MFKEVEIIQGKANNGMGNRGEEKLRVAAYCRVSTFDEDQEKSYLSQIEYYTNLINNNPDWILVKVYADYAISGGRWDKRPQYKEMMEDARNGKIDEIRVKSISRLMRNTVETLTAVRELIKYNVIVFFEEENLRMDQAASELMLTMFSAVAQQELYTTSDHVKLGQKMKMKKGELVSLAFIYGYNIDRKNKMLDINEKEAEVVREIFRKYTEERMGAVAIGKELDRLGIKTPGRSKTWYETTVRGILKNEKYKGELLQGKTFTQDPISKKRVKNEGQNDMYKIKGNHEAIIDEETFELAQSIMASRNSSAGKKNQKYAFSLKISCGFCGATYGRRSWNAGTKSEKAVWQCITSTKKGKENCKDSKGIAEAELEKIFMKSFHQLCKNNSGMIDKAMMIIKKSLKENDNEKILSDLIASIESNKEKNSKLLDLYIDGKIKEKNYLAKTSEIDEALHLLEGKFELANREMKNSNDIDKRIEQFKEILQNKDYTENSGFDATLFNSLIHSIIIGDAATGDPNMVTFVYYSGLKSKMDLENFKNKKGGTLLKVEDDDLYSLHNDSTHRNSLSSGKKKIVN